MAFSMIHMISLFLIGIFASFVSDLPRVIGMPVSVYLPKGMLGRIECPTDANPPITQVSWTKNEQPIDFNHSTRLKRNNKGMIIIKSVIASDEGRYSCIPCSAYGCGEPSSVVQVMVRGKYRLSLLCCHLICISQSSQIIPFWPSLQPRMAPFHYHSAFIGRLHSAFPCWKKYWSLEYSI